MKLYAERHLRAAAQITSDLLALAWTAFWVLAALSLHEMIMSLARPGELLESAGSDMTDHMSTAAENVEQVPMAGEALATPFTSVGEAGESLSSAGTSFQESIGTLALVLPLLTAALPVLLLAATWFPARARWVARANSARRLRHLDPGARERLLALRALSSAPAGHLAGVHEDPAGAWHDAEPAAVRDLADLELRRLGLKRV
ncbi:hypothetical protein IDM40_19620 [Nocardiopsis sp. HNM0947]|uniref:Transmembrane protein n=1 Tax=Nocardiopsis coralli TaxID=2772213 RepID=A0ABR9PAM8_9ACTN|nr:hypothetical protein [Nocardiopsis coralli]MBE3000884.1 hypothetical protein [Nocardiopsis coralli]